MRVTKVQYIPQVYCTTVRTKHVSNYATLNALNYVCIVYSTILSAADNSTMNYCKMWK